MQVALIYSVCESSATTFLFLSEAPPNIDVDCTFTFTLSGTNISIPPNIAVAFITWSDVIIALLKSHSIPPNIAVKSFPLNSSPSNLRFCPENAAQHSSFSFLFLFSSFIFLFTFPPIESLNINDKRSAQKQAMYRNIDSALLPAGESLKTTIERVIPYFNETVKKDMQAGKRALIVAHGNSLRALVKYFDKLSNEAIMNINIPTGIPLVYEFDDEFKVIKHYYLGDETLLKEKIDAVADQGKKLVTV